MPELICNTDVWMCPTGACGGLVHEELAMYRGADSRVPKMRRKSKVTFGADDTGSHFHNLGFTSGHSTASSASDMAPLTLDEAAAGSLQSGPAAPPQPFPGEASKLGPSTHRLRHSDGSASLGLSTCAWHGAANASHSADGDAITDGDRLGPLPPAQPQSMAGQTPHDQMPFPRSTLGRATSAPAEDLLAQSAHLHLGKPPAGVANSRPASHQGLMTNAQAGRRSGEWSLGAFRSLPARSMQEPPQQRSLDGHRGAGDPRSSRGSSARTSLTSNGDAGTDEHMARMFQAFTRQAASPQARKSSDHGSRRVSTLLSTPSSADGVSTSAAKVPTRFSDQDGLQLPSQVPAQAANLLNGKDGKPMGQQPPMPTHLQALAGGL